MTSRRQRVSELMHFGTPIYAVGGSPRLASMEPLRGQREGSIRWALDGFIYHKDNKQSNIYRCVKRKAPNYCLGCVTYEPKGGVSAHCAHNHDADPLGTEKILARERLISLARLTTYSFSKIWISVSDRFPEAMKEMSLRSMKSSMSRARAELKKIFK